MCLTRWPAGRSELPSRRSISGSTGRRRPLSGAEPASTRRAASPRGSSSMPSPSLISLIRLKPEPVQQTMTCDKNASDGNCGTHPPGSCAPHENGPCGCSTGGPPPQPRSRSTQSLPQTHRGPVGLVLSLIGRHPPIPDGPQHPGLLGCLRRAEREPIRWQGHAVANDRQLARGHSATACDASNRTLPELRRLARGDVHEPKAGPDRWLCRQRRRRLIHGRSHLSVGHIHGQPQTRLEPILPLK